MVKVTDKIKIGVSSLTVGIFVMYRYRDGNKEVQNPMV